MNVVTLRTYRDPSYIPVLVLIDMQQEYLSDSRALALNSTRQAIDNSRKLLSFAREYNFPVAHARWSQRSTFFSAGQKFSDWIDGFTPRNSDMVFERNMPSCYSSEAFAEMMTQGGGQNAIIAGFTGTIACLSTIVDASHRNHTLTFISDASASHGIGSQSEQAVHASVSDIISLYAKVTTTDQWITQQTKEHAFTQGISS